MKSLLSLIVVLVAVLGTACGSSPTAPKVPVGPLGSGTLVVTVLDGGEPPAPGTKIQVIQGGGVLREVGVDASGNASTVLDYGTYSIKVDGFGLESEVRTVEHNASETRVQFNPKPKDDIELLEIVVNNVVVPPGGVIPRTGNMFVRGRHRQVSIPWPGKVEMVTYFMGSQSGSGSVFVQPLTGFPITYTPTSGTWETRYWFYTLTCGTCTSAKEIRVSQHRPAPPGGGEMVTLVERKYAWAVTFQ